MASRKLFGPSTAVYQAGRGSEPMIEVGRVTPADALYIVPSLAAQCLALPIADEGKGRRAFRNRTLRFSPPRSSPAGGRAPALAPPNRGSGCRWGGAVLGRHFS